MEEALFIDAVDFEWCFRVTAQGFRLYGVCDAEMGHSLGDRVQSFWLFRTRRISVRSPLRHYYVVRNRLLLLRRPYVAWRWAWQNVLWLISLVTFFSLFLPPRLQYARMMGQGIWHGILGAAAATTGRPDCRPSTLPMP